MIHIQEHVIQLMIMRNEKMEEENNNYKQMRESVFDRISKHKGIEKDRCQYCHGKYKYRSECSDTEVKDGSYLVIEHIIEGGVHLHGTEFYRYLLTCDESELNNYNIFCQRDNKMKKEIYNQINAMKKIKNYNLMDYFTDLFIKMQCR